jgi:putative zinc finger/helix-turn-helix YgiT family protein
VTVTSPVAFCTACGEDVFDRELDFAALEMAYAEYRRRKGLPGPAEIAALRERLGLSRKALAEILGCGEDGVRRYELGAVPPPEHGEVLRRLAGPGAGEEVVGTSNDVGL